MCNPHYRRAVKGQDMGPPIATQDRNPPDTCTSEGCERPHYAKGLCQAHYKRFKRGSKDSVLRSNSYAGDKVRWAKDLLARARTDAGCLVMPCHSTHTGRGERIGYAAIVAEVHLGPCPEGQEPIHTCGRPECVRIEHLYYGTREDNAQHRTFEGRTNLQKLMPDDVWEIRRRLETGEKYRSIARTFEVHPDTIKNIDKGITWYWLTEGVVR